MLSRVGAGKLPDRLGSRRVALPLLALLAVALASTSLASARPGLLVVAAFIGVGIGILYPTMNLLVVERVPVSEPHRELVTS